MSVLRVMWFTLGSAALTLGAIGILLPILPTTPFVILAALAYARSAPRLAASLEQSRLFGPTLVNWRTHGAIAPRHKAVALMVMVGVFGASLALSVAAFVLIVQALCMTAAAAFILSRPNGAAG